MSDCQMALYLNIIADSGKKKDTEHKSKMKTSFS